MGTGPVSFDRKDGRSVELLACVVCFEGLAVKWSVLRVSLAALATAGCIYVPLGSVPSLDTTRLASGVQSVRLRPVVEAGGLRVQGLESPLTIANVRHVVVSLYELEGSAEFPVLNVVGQVGKPFVRDVPVVALDALIVLGSQVEKTRYRIRARAYDADGTAESSLISVDSSSFADVDVTEGSQTGEVRLPIRLRDKKVGEIRPGVVVAEGGVTHEGEEGIQ